MSLVSLACGSGSKQARPESAQSEHSASESLDGTSTTPAGYCDDATCFDCGETFCLPGWYCDETIPGGPACSAVDECGQESSCGCVEAALGADCRCEERNGGVFVRCD